MLLYIDTSDHTSLKFELVPNTDSTKKIKFFKQSLAFNENYKTLELLQKFLKQNKVLPTDLKKIIVCSGPGSFTGIRVGIALSQAIGYTLNIPVISIEKNKSPRSPEDYQKLWKLKSGKKLSLNYGREPNITKTKKL